MDVSPYIQSGLKKESFSFRFCDATRRTAYPL
jgi:hypothetical protein